jgi:predicted class III extradiol MEMO1 family dioxygenase
VMITTHPRADLTQRCMHPFCAKWQVLEGCESELLRRLASAAASAHEAVVYHEVRMQLPFLIKKGCSTSRLLPAAMAHVDHPVKAVQRFVLNARYA